MTKNESKARQILDAAVKTGADIPCAIYHIIDKKELPKLTYDECISIAINYPMSVQDVRDVFP